MSKGEPKKSKESQRDLRKRVEKDGRNEEREVVWVYVASDEVEGRAEHDGWG